MHSGKPGKMAMKCSLRLPGEILAGGSLSGLFEIGLALRNISAVAPLLGACGH
jgi:hypothetical protein